MCCYADISCSPTVFPPLGEKIISIELRIFRFYFFFLKGGWRIVFIVICMKTLVVMQFMTKYIKRAATIFLSIPFGVFDEDEIWLGAVDDDGGATCLLIVCFYQPTIAPGSRIHISWLFFIFYFYFNTKIHGKLTLNLWWRNRSKSFLSFKDKKNLDRRYKLASCRK